MIGKSLIAFLLFVIVVLMFECFYVNFCVMVLICLFGFGLYSGHGSFSNNQKMNSVVGHLLHSSILVPYHGWYVSDD